MNESLTIQDAAKLLGVSPTTLRRWEERNVLVPSRTVGNQRRYTREQLLTFRNNGFKIPDENLSQRDMSKAVFGLGSQTQPMHNPSSPMSSNSVSTDSQQKPQQSEPNVQVSIAPKSVEASSYRRYILPLSGAFATLLLFGGLVFAATIAPSLGENLSNLTKKISGAEEENAQVLAANDNLPLYLLRVNVPAAFGKKASFLDSVEIKKGLTVEGLATLKGGIRTENADIDAGTGRLTASNVVYSIVAGNNIAVTGDPQNPTISADFGNGLVTSFQGLTGELELAQGSGIGLDGLTITNTGVLSLQGQTGALSFTQGSGITLDNLTITNSDPGSAQKIFGTFRIGSTDITAGSNTDTFTFAAGSGVTLTPNTTDKSLTISANTGTASQWTTTGSDIYYDLGNVGIGTTTPGATLDVAGTGRFSGAVTFSSFGTGVVKSDGSGLLSSSALDLTTDVSGILPISNGGTGLSSTPTFGQLLIGNGTGYDLGNLTGTPNQVNISNGAGSIMFSLPQDIDLASSPTFSAFNLTSDTNQITLGTGTTGTLTMEPLTAPRTYTLPDASGYFCLSSGNCGNGGGGTIAGSGTTNYIAKFTSATGISDSTIYDNGKVGIGTINPTGLLTVSGAPAGKALAVFNYTGSGQNILTASASGTTRLTLGSNGTLNIIGGSYQIGGANVLTSDTLGAGIVNSSLVSVGPLSDGSITSGFGNIDVGNDSIIGGDIISNSSSGFIANDVGAGLTFNGSGNHDITANSGTLRLGAYTLNGAVTGNGQNITGLNNLSAGGTVTFGGLGTGVVRSTGGVLSSSALNLAAGSSYITGVLPVANGGTGLSSYTTGALVYASGGSTLAALPIGSEGQILAVSGSGTPSWISSSVINFWQRNNGTISPINITDDLLLGGISSASAKFRISGTTGNASTSGTLTFNTLGNIQTTNNQTLTIGGDTTGNISLSPANGNGSVISTGNLNLVSGKSYQINGANVLSAAALGTGVTSSSLTTVGALNSGTIATGFGTITTSNPIVGSLLNGTTGINTGSGTGVQRIDVNGNLTNIGTTQLNGITYTWPNADGSADYVLTTDSNGGLVWKEVTAVGGAGDITAIGDVISGPAFTAAGTQGTSLYFYDPQGRGQLTTANLTAPRTYSLPDADGTICLTSGNCAGSGGGLTGSGTSGQIAFFNGSGTLNSETSGFAWNSTTKRLGIGNDTPNGKLDVTGANTGKALVILNETGNQDILTASASGATVLTVNRNGDLSFEGQLSDLTQNVVTVNDGLDLVSGNSYSINGTTVLSASALGSGITGSSLTSVGALASGSIANGFGTILTNNTIQGSNITASGTTGFTATGNGAGLTFSGTGNHIISASSGTLQLGATTLTGAVTGNGQNLTGLANLSAGGTITFGGLTTGVVQSNGSGVLSSSALNLAGGASYISGTLPVANGGTGATSVGSAGSVAYSTGTAYAFSTVGSAGQVLVSNGSGAPTWASSGSVGTNFFQRNLGAVAPINITDDLLLGGISTGSAKFAFVNVAGGTPTASISANTTNNATYLTGDGTLGTTNRQTLRIGSSTTGNIVLNGFSTGIVKSNSSGVLSSSAINLNSADVTGTLQVANGGTGNVSFTANGVVYGNGANALSVTSAPTAGQVLLGNASGVPTFTTISGGITLSDTGLASIALSSVGETATTGSNSGLEFTTANGLSLLRGCDNTEILKWNDTSDQWECAPDEGGSGAAGVVNVQNNDVAIGVNIDTLDFGTDFSVVASPTNEANIAIANDILDFAKFADSLNLDAATSIAMSNFDLTLGTNSGTGGVIIAPNAGGKSALIVNKQGAGDIFSASASGTTKFTINNSGYLGIAGSAPASDAFISAPGFEVSDTADVYASSLLNFSSSNNASVNVSTLGTIISRNVADSNVALTVSQLNAGSTGDILRLNNSSSTMLAVSQLGSVTFGAAGYANCTALETVGGLLTCGTDDSGGGAGTNYWQINAGAIAPINSTLDLLVGGTSSSSAKFAVLNVNNGTPTASISANSGNNATFLSGNGILGTTNKQSLTLGSTSTGNVSLAPGGSAALTALANGNVGVGVTNPTAKFVVAGNGAGTMMVGDIGTGNAYTTISLNNAFNATDFNFSSSPTDQTLYINRPTGSAIRFREGNGTDQMYLAPGGFVGFGTNAPTAGLDVTGTASVSGSLNFRAGAGSIQTTAKNTLTLGGTTTGDIAFRPGNSASSLYLSSNGNVGLGTTTPSLNNALDIVRNQNSEARVSIVNNSAGADAYSMYEAGNDIGALFQFGLGSSTSTYYPNKGFIYSNAATDGFSIISEGIGSGIDFYTGGSTAGFNRMAIDGSGTVRITSLTNCNTIDTDANGVLSCGTDESGGVQNYWNLSQGALSPVNSTADLLVGGTSSSSAKFAVLNVNSGTPTASISAGATGGVSLTANGVLGTTNRQSLTLGNASTGNIVLNGFTAGVIKSNASGVLSSGTVSLTNGSSDISGILSVPNGGTGANTLAQGGVLYGNGTSAVGATTGTTGQALLSGGTGAPTWTTGTLALAGNFTTAGANALTLTTTGTTNITLPTTGTLATLAGTETLSNKTLTAPRIANAGFIADANGNEQLILNTTASAINELTLTNAAAGGVVTLAATGGDTNIPFAIDSKGTGELRLNGTATGNVLLAGGSGSTGCTVTNSTGAFACTGAVTGTNITGTNSGDQTITLTGDVSGSGTGSFATTIQDNSVDGTDIALGSDAAGDLMYYNGTDWVRLAAGTGNQLLHSGTTPSWGAVDLTTQVTGTLPIANGGTNSTATPTNGGIAYGNGSAYAFTSAGTNGQCLLSSGAGAPTWGSCNSGSAQNYWQLNNGAIAPSNETLDLLVGGTASNSAEFAILNVNSGTPTASVSAIATGNGISLAGDGNIQSLRNNTLTIGGDTTGNITLSPQGGNGTVTSTGNLNLSSTKAFQINGTNVLSASALGSGVTGSSLTSVGILNAGSITSGFGSIDVGSDAISGGNLTGSGTTGLTLSGSGADISFTGGGTNIISSTGTLQLNAFTMGGAITGAGNAITGLGQLGVDNLTLDGTTLSSTGDLNIDVTGGDVIFANTNTLNIGGNASDVAYNVIADTIAGASGNMNSDDDLYIEGDLEVDGTVYGNISGNTFTSATGDITLDANGGDIIIANNDTLNVGGYAGGSAFNVIGSSVTNNNTADGDNDLYIEDELEVDGVVTIGNTTNGITFSAASGAQYYGTARKVKTISLQPEYAGAALTSFYGTGTDTNITGLMTSDVETTGTNGLRTYYEWKRTADATQHFYTVAVRVRLPKDFSAWDTNGVQVDYKTDSATSTVSDLDVRVYQDVDASMASTDGESLNNASTSWTTVSIAGSTLNEVDAADETAVIYLRMGSASSSGVRIGELRLNYLSSF